MSMASDAVRDQDMTVLDGAEEAGAGLDYEMYKLADGSMVMLMDGDPGPDDLKVFTPHSEPIDDQNPEDLASNLFPESE